MPVKVPPCPDRIRSTPKQFSWIDHRLVQKRHIDGLSHHARSLYLFLVTVADAKGLSYYSLVTLSQRLRMSTDEVIGAQKELEKGDLVAYGAPVYQVLPLEDDVVHPRHGLASKRDRKPMEPIDVILQRIVKGSTHD